MIVNKENKELVNLACQKHLVERLFIFGSAASGKMYKNSDVDVLVKFAEMDLYNYFNNLLSLKEDLEIIFNRPVDLLEEQSIRNPYLKRSINRNKILIYGRENSQMAT